MVLGAFKKLVVLAAVAVASVSASATATPNAPYYNEHGILQIGAIELLNITTTAAVNSEHIISYPGASYISVKFENVDLPAGDVLIFALESICGAADQTHPAKCISGVPYTKAKAVAILLIDSRFFCTGWLISSSGHLVTNHSCVDAASDAEQVDVESNAESVSCSDMCAVQLGCKGTLDATAATFVRNDAPDDYALLKPPAAFTTKYGFLHFCTTGQLYNELSSGWASRIVNTVDGGTAATIRFTGRTITCGDNQVGCLVDTHGGSSGEPVLVQRNNLVVGHDHCGSYDNVAVHPRLVLADLKRRASPFPTARRKTTQRREESWSSRL